LLPLLLLLHWEREEEKVEGGETRIRTTPRKEKKKKTGKNCLARKRRVKSIGREAEETAADEERETEEKKWLLQRS
jgi:hypothetical protein